MQVAPQPGFCELLRPYKRTEIAKKLGVECKRVDKWANGLSLPAITELPRLAEIIRVPLDFLVASIAVDEAADRNRTEPAA
jgi:transcriptional regulator with XRE-family HTH domain